MVYRWYVRMSTSAAQMSLKTFMLAHGMCLKEVCCESFVFALFQSSVLSSTLKKQATYYQFSAINFILVASVWPIPSTKISPISFPSFYLESLKCFQIFSPSVRSSTGSRGCGKRSLSVPRRALGCNSVMVVDVSQRAVRPLQVTESARASPASGSHCWMK